MKKNKTEEIEFIIDENTALNYYGVGDNGYVLNGSYNNADEFNGNIIKIIQIMLIVVMMLTKMLIILVI